MNALFHTFGITDLWQLVAATLVFLMLPGPGTFCILTGTGQRGLRGGFASLFGLMIGDAALMFLASIGVAALLQANPLLFKAVQYLGAAYLAYFGFTLLTEKEGQGDAVRPFANLADFRRGLLTTLINPKAIVFYMAFFPLFIDPVAHRGAVTFLAMGAVISMCTLFCGSLLVITGNALARRLARNRRIAAFGLRLAGIFLIGFGIKLIIN